MDPRHASNPKPTHWVALVLLVLVNHLSLPLHLALEHHCIGHGVVGSGTGCEAPQEQESSCADEDGHPPHPIEDHADDRPDPATRSDLDRDTGDDQPIDRAGTPLLLAAPQRFPRTATAAPDRARAPPLESSVAPRGPPATRSPSCV